MNSNNQPTHRFNLQIDMPGMYACVMSESEHVQSKIADLVADEVPFTPHMGAAWRNGLAHALMQGLLSPRTAAHFMGTGMTVPARIRNMYDV